MLLEGAADFGGFGVGSHLVGWLAAVVCLIERPLVPDVVDEKHRMCRG